MDSLYIVMPAYNEEANIEAVVNAWYPLLEEKNDNSRLVIADSGSSDNTHKILVRLQQEYDKIVILSDTQKQHGPKVIALYGYAIKNGASYVFQTDSDGQTSPEEFEEFWKLRDKYAAVFGNRVVRGDGKARAFIEKVVCFMLKLYFKVDIPDANAPFRLMDTSVLKKYLCRLPLNYNLPNIILSMYYVFYNEKYTFKKISFNSRQGGKNSINIRKIVLIGFNALRDFKQIKKQIEKEICTNERN